MRSPNLLVDGRAKPLTINSVLCVKKKQPLELLCVLHYSFGKGCFHDEGTAVGRTVTLCIDEIHTFLVSCVVMDGQGQSQYLGLSLAC